VCSSDLVLSDGSSDRTADIVKGYNNPRIHLLDLPRGGKATALNAGVKASSNEIIVFSVFANIRIKTFTATKIATKAKTLAKALGISGKYSIISDCSKGWLKVAIANPKVIAANISNSEIKPLNRPRMVKKAIRERRVRSK